MCIMSDTLLTDRQTHDARDRFGDIFQRLLDTRQLTPVSSDLPCQDSRELAINLNQLSSSRADCLQSLPRHDSYSRNIIGISEKWIGFICRWEPNTTSSIHGHPAFAYYQVLDGVITMDLFEPINDRQARQVACNEMRTGDFVISTTQEGRFDNLVHRVNSGNNSVYTLHLYSDNPARGDIFQAV